MIKSTSLLSRIAFKIAGLFPEDNRPKYDSEGNLIERKLPKLPPTPPQMLPKQPPPALPKRRVPSTHVEAPPKSAPLNQKIKQKLEDAGVILVEYETRCPFCKWESDGKFEECPECSTKLKHGRDPMFNVTYDPVKHHVYVRESVRLPDLESFAEYLDEHRRDTYTADELQFIHAVTNTSINSIKNTLEGEFKKTLETGSKTEGAEYTSIPEFVAYIKGNDKDYCTSEQFAKLFNYLAPRGLWGISEELEADGEPAIIYSGATPAQKREFLKYFLLKDHGITVGRSTSVVGDKSDSTSSAVNKAELKKLETLASLLVDKHGNPVSVETVKKFIKANGLMNVPGTEPVVETWIKKQQEEVVRDFASEGLTMKKLMSMIAHDLIPEELGSSGLYGAIEEALTRPEAQKILSK